MPTTPEEAVCARLKAFAPLAALVGPRVFPQITTQDADFPFVAYPRVGVEVAPTLGAAGGKLKKYLIRVDTVAPTEQATHAPAGEVVNALHNWRDAPAGVQGVFHTDSDAQALDDGTRVLGHTFAVWHKA